jgi:hypothetical protein
LISVPITAGIIQNWKNLVDYHAAIASNSFWSVIASFSKTGNMYGWDASQNWPSLLSAYSRHLVEWVQVVEVTHSQDIHVKVSCDSDIVYKINHRMPSDDCGEEYFLIENRGACGYDIKLKEGSIDRQGIVIWHVDHTGFLGLDSEGKNVIGYDTQRAPSDKAWPGVHSRLSLLPADGQFELETNKNRGNEYDAFRKSTEHPTVAYMISNEGITKNNGEKLPYPNTKSIAKGSELHTGITIQVLSSANYTMTVRITLQDRNGVKVVTAPPTRAPVAVPTPPPVPPPKKQLILPTNPPMSGTSNGSTSQAANPTATVVTSPTKPPVQVGVVPTSNSGFVGTCGDSQWLEFEVGPGIGKSNSMYSQIKQCQFISNKPDEREDVFCVATDLQSDGGDKKVYEKCQKECPKYTGC